MKVPVAALLAAVVLAPAAAYAAETAVVDGRTFVFVPGDSISVMDVTSPSVPLAVAGIPVSPQGLSYGVVDGAAYLAAVDADGVLHILDVTAPYMPAAVSELSLSGGGHALPDVSDVDWAVADGGAYVLVSAGDSVRVVNATDPRSPTPAGSIDNGDWRVHDLDAVAVAEPFRTGQGAHVLVADSDTVHLVNFAAPASPWGMSFMQQGEYGFGTAGDIADLDVVQSGDRVYALVTGNAGITVADITDPAHPVHTATVGLPGLTGTDVLAAGGAAYALAMGADAVHIIDIGDAESPAGVSAVPLPAGDVLGVESNGRLWVLSIRDGVVAGADITDPASPVPAYVQRGGFSHATEAVETVSMGGKLYALALSTARSTIQITDITDPANPVPVSAVVGGKHSQGSIHGPNGVAVAHIGGMTYAVVANIYSDSIAVLDITDPRMPAIVSTVDFPGLGAVASVATVEVGQSVYAAVGGFYVGGIRLVDITDPASPGLGAPIQNQRYGFGGVAYPISMDAVTIDGSPHLLVADYYSGAMQIINVADPDWPIPVAALFDGVDGHSLAGPHDVEAVRIGDRTFAVVATAYDSSVTVIDITDPGSPSVASRVTDGRGGFDHLKGVQHLDAVERDGRTLVAATSYFEYAIQLMDITDPGSPAPLPSAVQGEDGFDALSGPTDVSAVSFGDGTYVVAGDYFGNGIQIAEITDAPALRAASSLSAGYADSMHLVSTTGVRSVAVSDRTYALTASPGRDAVQITDITDPRSPVPVSLIRDVVNGFVMDDPMGISAGFVSHRPYAFITSATGDGIQIGDIADPANPVSVHRMQTGLDGIAETEFAYVDGTPYLFVAALPDALQIIDVAKPSKPAVVSSLPGAIPDIQGMDVVHTADGVLALLISFENDALHIVDVADPANPRRVSTTTGEHLSSVTDVDSMVVDGRTLAAVSSYRTDSVSLLDITDPSNPVLLSSVRGHEGGLYLHGPESLKMVAIGDGVFLAVVNGNDSLQIVDITDPRNPALADATGLLLESTVYGATDVETVVIGSDTYVLFQTIDENITPVMNATNPYDLAGASLIPPIHSMEPFP